MYIFCDRHCSRKCNCRCDRCPVSQCDTLMTFFSLWRFTSICLEMSWRVTY